MKDYKTTLEPGSTCHIYNRANGSERLFVDKGNYVYFLEKYRQYISPVAHTFCYCLLPNHFHFLVQVKDEETLKLFFQKETRTTGGGKGGKDLQGLPNLEGLEGLDLAGRVSRQFSNYFNAYAKAFNKQQQRKGSLFMHTYKRKRVDSNEYLRKLIHYIHYNPVEANLCQHPQEWEYSSYRQIVERKNNMVECSEVIDWFGDMDNFIYCHTQAHG